MVEKTVQEDLNRQLVEAKTYAACKKALDAGADPLSNGADYFRRSVAARDVTLLGLLIASPKFNADRGGALLMNNLSYGLDLPEGEERGKEFKNALKMIDLLAKAGILDESTWNNPKANMALSYAAHKGNTDFIDHILKRLPDISEERVKESLHGLRSFVLKNDDVATLRLAVQKGYIDLHAPVDNVGGLPQKKANGPRPVIAVSLMGMAAASGAIECMRYLKAQGQSYDAPASDNSTPLMLAAFNKQGAAVDFLLDEGGADISARNFFKKRAIDYAKLKENHEIYFRLCRAHEATASAKQSKGVSKKYNAAGDKNDQAAPAADTSPKQDRKPDVREI